MAEETEEPITLPQLVVELLVALATWMRADTGRWRLEFEFGDGHLERWFRHEGPAGHAGLDQFESSSA